MLYLIISVVMLPGGSLPLRRKGMRFLREMRRHEVRDRGRGILL